MFLNFLIMPEVVNFCIIKEIFKFFCDYDLKISKNAAY